MLYFCSLPPSGTYPYVTVDEAFAAFKSDPSYLASDPTSGGPAAFESVLQNDPEAPGTFWAPPPGAPPGLGFVVNRGPDAGPINRIVLKNAMGAPDNDRYRGYHFDWPLARCFPLFCRATSEILRSCNSGTVEIIF